MLTLLSGLAAGSVHVVSGPDHLAALAPLAMDEPRRGLKTGATWGLGHGVGVVIIATIGQLLRGVVSLDAVSAWSELLVGFVLIAVGLWALRSATRMVVHSHAHDHDADDHQHLHVHSGHDDHESPEAHRGHTHASFWIGALHGSAGTGHLFGVLPSLALSPGEAAIYLAAYFVAAIVSMAAFGALLGRLVRVGGMGAMRVGMMAAALSAVAIGAVWIGQAWPV